MKILGVLLFLLFLALSNCAFADVEQELSFVGEWYVGSFFSDPEQRLLVKEEGRPAKEDITDRVPVMECDGYQFSVARKGYAIYVTDDDDTEPVKVTDIDFSGANASVFYWEDKAQKELTAYYFQYVSSDYVYGHKIEFDKEHLLFLDDEVYVKTESELADGQKSDIKKFRYLYHGNELFFIADNNYERWVVLGLSDMYAMMLNTDPVRYVEGHPVYNIAILFRTAAIK